MRKSERPRGSASALGAGKPSRGSRDAGHGSRQGKPNAALFSAAILAVSASQIRYAQEVREYSLSVLCAAILIYCLLRWEAAGSRSRHPALLYALLFFAPLIQYGLVFFAFAVLSTIVLRILLTRDTRFRLSHVADRIRLSRRRRTSCPSF